MGFISDILKILGEGSDKNKKGDKEKEYDKYGLFDYEKKAAREFDYPAESFDEESLEEDDYYNEDD